MSSPQAGGGHEGVNKFEARPAKKPLFTRYSRQVWRCTEKVALAPGAGFEPATIRLTVECSTAELSGNRRTVFAGRAAYNKGSRYCKGRIGSFQIGCRPGQKSAAIKQLPAFPPARFSAFRESRPSARAMREPLYCTNLTRSFARRALRELIRCQSSGPS